MLGFTPIQHRSYCHTPWYDFLSAPGLLSVSANSVVLEKKWMNGWSAATTFGGECSNVTSVYRGGPGVIGRRSKRCEYPEAVLNAFKTVGDAVTLATLFSLAAKMTGSARMVIKTPTVLAAAAALIVGDVGQAASLESNAKSHFAFELPTRSNTMPRMIINAAAASPQRARVSSGQEGPPRRVSETSRSVMLVSPAP